MQRKHIARALSIAVLGCTAGIVGLAPAQPEPETKKTVVLRLRTDEGVVTGQIVTDEKVQDLLISEVQLVDDKGRLTGKLGVDRKGTFSLRTLIVGLPPVRLGLTTEVVPEPLAVHLDMEPVEGLLVTSLVEGQAADKGGLMRYDVLVELDGETPVTQQTLRKRVQFCKPGELIKLSVVRKGQPFEVVVVAEEQDPESETVVSWTVDSTRRYVTGQPVGTYEFVGTPDESTTAKYRWTPDESRIATALYKVIASDTLPDDLVTGIVSTRPADGGLLLDITAVRQGETTAQLLARDLTLRATDQLQVAVVDPSDPIGNIKAQIAAMKRELAALEALVDQLDPPRD